MTEHDLRVTYTNEDDGIHLFCTPCHWDQALGYDVTPEAILAAAELHRLPTRCPYVGEKAGGVETGQQGGMHYQCTDEEGHDGWHTWDEVKAKRWLELGQ